MIAALAVVFAYQVEDRQVRRAAVPHPHPGPLPEGEGEVLSEGEGEGEGKTLSVGEGEASELVPVRESHGAAGARSTPIARDVINQRHL